MALGKERLFPLPCKTRPELHPLEALRYSSLGSRQGGSGMIYRPSTIKRKRRTKAQIDQLDNQICEALAQHHPQSIRHVFYLMTNPRLPEPVEKTDNGYRHVQEIGRAHV